MNGKTMTNNKQSSVDILFEELFNSFEKYNNGEFSFAGYMTHNLTLREQAKAMHKNEIMDARTNGRWACTEKYGEIRTNIQYYNETFGDKK
jgi:hypothetical protein